MENQNTAQLPQNIIKAVGVQQDEKWGKKNPMGISDGQT